MPFLGHAVQKQIDITLAYFVLNISHPTFQQSPTLHVPVLLVSVVVHVVVLMALHIPVLAPVDTLARIVKHVSTQLNYMNDNKIKIKIFLIHWHYLMMFDDI